MKSQFKIKQFHLVPYIINDEEGVVGVQLVLGDDGSDDDTKYMIVPMISSMTYNNIYKYESSICRFGYTKFYNIQSSKDSEAHNSAYFLLISSKIKVNLILACNLNSCEILMLL